MAVDLRRTKELLLCPREFQLANDQNDVGLGDTELSWKRFNDTQKLVWDHLEAPNHYALSSSSSWSSSDQSSELASSTTTETETYNEGDDCIAELTREMTRYMIGDHDKRGTEETWDFGGWPYTSQPWSPFGSSYGSTEGSSSRDPTPPATPGNIEKRHVWDMSNKLENSNSADMQKMNKYDEKSKYVTLRSLPTKPTSAPTVLEDPSADFCPNQAPTLDNKIRAFQLYRMKQELLLRQQSRVNQQFELNKHRLQYAKNKEKARQVHPWSNWASQQQGSGMRAVFLGGSGQRNGSCGTGVFLPCVIGDASQSRKKKGCSPVLIPAKVMQALKVHFDRMGNVSRQDAINFPMQRDTYKTESKDGTCSHKTRVSRAGPAMNQNDVGLPQDWTY